MARTTQQKTVEITRGLFLIRYAAAEDEGRAPVVKVIPDPASEQNITFVLHPDHKEAVLWQPDTCLVVRAMTQGKLSIEVSPVQENGPVAATVRIEPLSQGQPTSMPAQSSRSVRRSVDWEDFRVLGHVASIGDVVVNAGDWLAGPSAPSRIEGISMAWPGKANDIEIRYSVKTARPQTGSERATALGSFAGTRGKALPIVGLTLEMSGPDAANVQFAVDALFLGSPLMRATGKLIVLSGPTGREPLVGLRVGLEHDGANARPQPSRPATEAVRPAGRVRVFRSRPRQDQQAKA
jgi:hypothetical protein